MPTNNTTMLAHSVTEYAEISLYSLMLVCGLPVNLLSLRDVFTGWYASILRYRYQDARFLLLKLHLIVADLLVLCYALAHTIWLSTFEWLAPEWLCKVVLFMWTVAFYGASNVIVCVAVDRSITVNHAATTASGEHTYRRMIWMLRFAWGLAVGCSMPQLFLWVLVEPIPQWYQCTTVWQKLRFDMGLGEQVGFNFVEEKVYEFTHLLLLFWIPVLVMLACHVWITCRMRQIGLTYRAQAQAEYASLSMRETPSFVADCMEIGDTTLPLANGKISRSSRNSTMTQLTLNQPYNQPSSFFANLFRHKRTPVESPVLWKSSLVSTVAESTCEQNYTNSPLVHARAQLRSLKWRHTRRKTMQQFCAIIMVYFLCFLPYSVLSLWSRVHFASFVRVGGENCEFLKGLIVLEAVVNPFLYKFGSCACSQRRR